VSNPTYRDIRRYYLFQALFGLRFFPPVIYLFYSSRGLSVAEIMLLVRCFFPAH
jgi:hypothetical protein